MRWFELGETQGHKSFLNSILRKASEKEVDKRIKLNFPKWMLGSWKKAYGQEKLEKIMEVFMTEPGYIDFTYKGGETKRGKNIDQLSPDCWVQDSSQIHAVQMLGDIEGKSVLDMCAAPGGKTAQLIDAGAVVTAIDSSRSED